MDDVRKDIQKLKVPNWKTLAQDRRRWKELVEKGKTVQRVVEPNKKKKKMLITYNSFCFEGCWPVGSRLVDWHRGYGATTPCAPRP
jgi:hypothetical protein